jgi:hypothetical protein
MICLLCKLDTARSSLTSELTSCIVIICTVAIGVNVQIQPGAVEESGLLHASKLGWQLVYILPVAIVFNSQSSP